jgi:hypothetical protein
LVFVQRRFGYTIARRRQHLEVVHIVNNRTAWGKSLRPWRAAGSRGLV